MDRQEMTEGSSLQDGENTDRAAWEPKELVTYFDRW